MFVFFMRKNDRKQISDRMNKNYNMILCLNESKEKESTSLTQIKGEKLLTNEEEKWRLKITELENRGNFSILACIL